jgi:lipopolysaccharide export system permease protein
MSGRVNTFDRYLLKRYLHVFAIGFIATYGLYIVFDAFSNADEFQDRNGGSGTLVMLGRMAQHYGFQAFPFLDLVGPILIVLSAIAVFAILFRQSEIYPILSAGIPAWRLAVPVIIGTLSIVAALTINQELVIPSIANRLQARRDHDKTTGHLVQRARDFVSHVEIGGDRLYLAERKITKAKFLLPAPHLVREPVTLSAEYAIQVAARGQRPAGWLLKGVTQKFDELPLTESGNSLVFAAQAGDDLFVATDVTVDQLHNRTASFKYLSTAELIERIQNPAFGLVSIRSQTLHLHERLTKPVLIVMSVLIAIPLTIRRESRGLLLNIASAAAVLAVLFVLAQSSMYLGRLNVVSLDLAAWLPVVVTGICGAWFSASIQT